MSYPTREAHLTGSVAAVAGVYDYVERPSEGSPVKGHTQVPHVRPPDSPYVLSSHLASGVAAVSGVYPLNKRPAERIRPHPQLPAEPTDRHAKGQAPSREQSSNLRLGGDNHGTGLPISEIERARPSRTAPVARPKPMFQRPNYAVPGGAPPKAGVRPQFSQLTHDLKHEDAYRAPDGGQAWLDMRGAIPHRAPGDWKSRGANTANQLTTNLVPAETAEEAPISGVRSGRSSAGVGPNNTSVFQVGTGLTVNTDPRGDFSKGHAQVIRSKEAVLTVDVPDANARHGRGGRDSELAKYMRVCFRAGGAKATAISVLSRGYCTSSLVFVVPLA